MPKQTRKVRQIIDTIEAPQQSGSLAAWTAYYWPTIRAALDLYAKSDMPVLRNNRMTY